MNGKALVLRLTDVQNIDDNGVETTRMSFDVMFIASASNFKQMENIDVVFLPADTVAQIRTKIRNAIISVGAGIGMTVTSTNISSIMQI